MRRSSALFAIMLTALLIAAPAGRAQTSEQLVKATFLYRFASFVTWPASAFADPQTPIRICVMGADPFAQMLERVVVNQRVDGRAFEVRRLDSVTGASQCHVVYVVGDRVDDVLRGVHGLPVLTITDGSMSGGDTRGIIHFVIVDDRVRFHIDDARAAESGLFMSSRLLSLAVSVRRRASS